MTEITVRIPTRKLADPIPFPKLFLRSLGINPSKPYVWWTDDVHDGVVVRGEAL